MSPVEDYLAKLPEPAQSTLRKLVTDVRAALRDTEDTTTYGMPGFRYQGRPLLGFRAFKQHCGLFPMSPAVITGLEKELAKYTTSKGGIQFPPDKPLPATLVRKIVRARAAEIDAKPAR
jgi:uncharacterized protein YdhG (YjbR/CyaY superfamily)